MLAMRCGFRNTFTFSTLFTLVMLFGGPFVVGLDPVRRASGNNVAVCTLPAKTDPATVSNLVRGITLTICPSATPPPPAGVRFAFVSITPESGFQQQFWDIGGDNFDSYWLRQYLDPQLGGFKTDCWEAPQEGCARPAGLQPPTGFPKGSEMKLAVAQPAKAPEKEGKTSDPGDTSDADLVPLGDPSLAE